MIRIGVNVSFTPSGGSFTQVVNMIDYLDKKENITLIVFSKEKNRNSMLNLDKKKHQLVESRLSNISALTRVVWEQLFLPFYLIKYKVDLLFCPGDISPIFTFVKKVQWIGTIGPFWDPIYDYDIGIIKRIKYPLNKLLMYKSAEYADHVIFESNYTKDYFLQRYKIEERNTSVINIGKDEVLMRTDSINPFDGDIDLPFVLCVSHLYPYKNIPRMIKSFYYANKKNGHSHKLVIAGAFILDKYTSSIYETIDDLEYNDYILLLGKVDKNHLRFLYENCDFLLFPSPCENFAYTLVEAMSFGAPVVCSNTTAMPDTCLDAAVYFNPYDGDDMTDKISILLKDNELRKQYGLKSISRANSLPTYKQVTEATLDVFYKFIDPEEYIDEQ